MNYCFTQHFHLINVPPLLFITIFFIIGIIFHTIVAQFFIFCIVLAGISLFFYIKYKKFSKHLIIYSSFLVLGAYLHHREWLAYNNFYTLVDGKKITVIGTVTDISDTVVNNKNTVAMVVTIDAIKCPQSLILNHTYFSIGIPYLKNTEAWGKNIWSYNKSFVFYKKNSEDIMVGDTVRINNVSCKKPATKDFQRYQIKEQIIATVFDETITYTIENHPAWSLRYWLWSQKNRLLHSLKSKLSHKSFLFFSSLFLGNRSCIKKELEDTNEQFKTWGISHFLARSGLHLVLFIFIWQALLRLIPLPFLIKQIILLLFSCLYFILTWTSAPFSRSFALFILNKLCLFSKIPFHLLHYLILVCLLFLLYCPLYLFFLDFQLSFTLTFALAWFNQVMSQHKKI